MFNLRDKVILVTGASRGIGAAIARACGEAGGSVAIHYGRSRSNAEEVARAVGPDRSLLLPADLLDDQAVLDLWRRALAWKGRIDVLINNAGVQLFAGVDSDFDSWNKALRDTLQVNTFAGAHLAREAIRHFKTRGGGVIITIASQAATQGVRAPTTMAYAASKGACKAFANSVARCYSIDNILSYTINPGLVDTEIAEDFIRSYGDRQAVLDGFSMGDLVPPEEIGTLCAFLATGQVRHATGTSVEVTGATYIR